MRRKVQEGQRADAREKPIVEIPHDVTNEQVVIAAALVGGAAVRAKLLGKVRPDMLYGDGHAEIWTAVGELQRRGLEYSAATLQQLSGGAIKPDYLNQLVATHPAVPANLRHHVEDGVEWDHARIGAVRGPIGALLRELKDPTAPPDKVRALAASVATAFNGHSDRRFLRDPATLVREHMIEVKKRAEEQAIYPYGVAELDYDAEAGKHRMIPGCAPGHVTVITGVPGSGKSTFTARIALEQAKMKRRVLYGAWEMKSGVTLELLAALDLGWSRYVLSTGDLCDEDLGRLEAKMHELSTYVRFVEMPFGRVRNEKRSNDQNLDIIHGYIADSAADVAIFDLWKRALRYTDPDDEEQALVRQQAMAQETRCHVLIVQQQRAKDIESRPDKRPTREGIKGTGAYFEVADTVIGAHRPALWKNVPDTTFEAIVLKQRLGKWPLAVEFDWDAEFGSIKNGRNIDYDPPGALRAYDNDVDNYVGRK